jgi:hypothetical protein
MSSAARAAIPLAQRGTPAAVRPQKRIVSICPMKDPASAKDARRFAVGRGRDHFKGLGHLNGTLPHGAVSFRSARCWAPGRG